MRNNKARLITGGPEEMAKLLMERPEWISEDIWGWLPALPFEYSGWCAILPLPRIILDKICPAAPPPPPPGVDIRVENLTIQPTEVQVGQSVLISIRATNYGDASGSKTVTCSVDGTSSEQSVTLNPDESRVVSFEVVPHEAKVYQVSVNGLIGSFTAVAAPTFYWLRPTGHVEGRWSDAELAYDGWTDTRAEVVNVGTQSWSPYLELTIEPTEISAVRWWGSSPVSPRKVQVDVRYYDGTYHNIYEGSAVKMWDNGLPIPGGAQVISGARIRFYNPSPTRRMKFRVNEFQFYGYAEEPPPPLPPPPTTKLFGRVTDRMTGAPIVGAGITVYQDYDGKTETYPATTDTQGYYLIDNMLYDVDQTLMVIYADGYQTHTDERVSISEGDNRLDIRMTPE